MQCNKNLYLKGMACTVCHLTLFKNWLKNIFVLTAYVWEAAPCSTLPTADENAVTESVVTTVSSSLFQSATVLMKNEFLYCSVSLSEILKPQELRISCLAMVLSESLAGGRAGGRAAAYSSSISDCWHQEALWRHGWDVALHNLVECCQPLLLPTFPQWWQV